METHTTDKIFISYSRHDEKIARRLATWIEKTLNLGVWIDVDDIQPGVKWSAAIQDGLDYCEVMVVIITVESMNSINVEDEWQYFLDQGKPVVPILLRSAPIPYQLRRIQYIDFSVRDDMNNSQRELIVELRQHLKPLSGEEERKRETLDMRSAGHNVASKKEKTRKKRMRKAEDVLERQDRALKRNNSLIGVLVVLLIVMGLGFGAFAYWVYINQVTYFGIRNSSSDAVAYLPTAEGEPTQVVPVSELVNGRAPAGTRIETGDEPLEIYSEEGGVAAVIQPNSATIINDLSTEGVDLDVEQGNISVDSQGIQGRISAFGIDFDITERIMLEIDEMTGNVRADCYDGCMITDAIDGRSRQLNGGDSITFSGEERDFDTAEIVPIPGAIAFVTLRHGAAEIYLMQSDGSGLVQLTHNGFIQDISPSWSPDARMIAFVTDREGSFDIAIMPPNGTEDDVQILTSDSRDNERDPAWSPDGTRIAFVSNRRGGIDNLFVMDADGSNVLQLTERAGANSDPTWSSDSTKIAFVSTRTGNSEIFILDLTSEDEPINLTNNEASDSEPAWSPDGTRMAFVSLRDTTTEEVYVLNLQDNSLVNVSNDGAIDSEPTWSPDSAFVLFTSQRFGNNDIMKVRSDGSGEVLNLTDLPTTADEEANWLPQLRAGG